MKADLHIHSDFSDGVYSPETIAKMAKEAGLECLAVTDHDNMGGVLRAEAAAKKEGLCFLRGWEVSSYLGPCKIHILGYGCRMDETYEKFVAERRHGGLLRAQDTIARANAFFGLDVTMSEVEAHHAHSDMPLHTMHIVRTFADRLERDVNDVFRAAFAFGGAAHSLVERPTPLEATAVIKALGGVAVLAHPGRIFPLTEEDFAKMRAGDEAMRRKNIENREKLMEKLIGAGLGGIECYYPTHTASETEYFLQFARAHGLLVTGGSDFHAKGTRQIGQPPFEIDGETLSRLVGGV